MDAALIVAMASAAISAIALLVSLQALWQARRQHVETGRVVSVTLWRREPRRSLIDKFGCRIVNIGRLPVYVKSVSFWASTRGQSRFNGWRNRRTGGWRPLVGFSMPDLPYSLEPGRQLEIPEVAAGGARWVKSKVELEDGSVHYDTLWIETIENAKKRPPV
jgi:hypothetical protein